VHLADEAKMLVRMGTRHPEPNRENPDEQRDRHNSDELTRPRSGCPDARAAGRSDALLAPAGREVSSRGAHGRHQPLRPSPPAGERGANNPDRPSQAMHVRSAKRFFRLLQFFSPPALSVAAGGTREAAAAAGQASHQSPLRNRRCHRSLVTPRVVVF
jgi:hypothetical protein